MPLLPTRHFLAGTTAILVIAGCLTAVTAIQPAGAQQAGCSSPQTVTSAGSLSQAFTCANASQSIYQIITAQPINITGVPLSSTGSAGTIVGGSPLTSTTAAGTADLTVSGVLGLTSTGLTTYKGDTVVTGGLLQAGAVNAFSPNSNFVVSGGTVDLGGYSNAIGSLSGTGGAVVNGKTATAILTVGGSGLSTTYGGSVDDSTGSLALTKIGAGSLALTGPNTYSGGTIVDGGTIVVSTSTSQATTQNGPVTVSSIGTGTLTLDGGTLQTTKGGVLTLANPIQAAAGGATIDQQQGGLTLSGVVAGPGAITYVNTGGTPLTGTATASNSVDLTATNSYSGGSILRSGAAIIANANNALGTGALQIDAGGVLDENGFNQTVTTMTGGGIIFAAGGNNAANSVTLSTLTVENGNVTGNILQGFTITNGATNYGDFTLVKASDGTAPGGTLTLAGANTYGGRGGSTLLQAGTIAVGSAKALGSGPLVMSDGTTLQLASDNIGLNNLVTLNGNDRFDTQAFAAGLGLHGVISGTGTLDKIGSTGLALYGANTYSGGTTLEAGGISLYASGALGTGALTFAGAGATLAFGASGITLANTAALANSATLDAGTFNDTYAGVISGSGALIKAGSGSLALTGANTYTGGTTIGAGTLNVAVSTAVTQGANPTTSSSIGSGALTIDGGALQAQAGTVVTLGNAIQVTANGATLDSNTGALHLNGAITGAGSITFAATGQTFTGSDYDATSISLAGANTYAGGSLVQSGATVQVLATNALGSGSLQIAQGGDVDLAGFGQTVTSLTGAGQIIGTGSRTGAQNSVTLETLTVQSGTFAGVVASGNHFITNGNGGTTVVDYGDITLVKVSDGSASGGVLTLSGNNTYGANGGGTLLQGGTIAVGSNTALGTGPLAMANGTTLAESVGVTLANAVSLAGAATIQTSDSSSGDGLILNGTVSGTGTLVKTGTSGLRLAGSNTYSGGTLLDAGHIGIASNTALGTGTLTFAGGFLRAHADGFTVGNAAVLSQNGAIDTNGFGLTYAGAISGAGQLTKAGAGTLTLSGVNSFTGGTALTAGTIAVGNNAALGSGALAMADGTTLQQAGNGLTLANALALTGNGTIDTQAYVNGFGLGGVVSGTGHLTKIGSGTLSLTATNTFSGGTALNAGTISIGSGTALGSGAITFGGGTLQVAANNLTQSNAISLNTFGTLDTQAFSATQSGVVSGAGALTKLGSGTLALSGNNSYSGGTVVAAGTIAVGASTALGTGTLQMADGTSLRFLTTGLSLANPIVFTGTGDPTIDTGSGTQTISGAISGSSSLTKIGSGTLDLTGIDTYTGPTTVAAGTLLVDGSIANSAVNVANGAILGGGGTIGGLTLQSGSVIAPGVRTLTINGNLTFAAGATYQATINGDGTSSRLAIGGTAALGGATLSLATGTGTFGTNTTATLLTATGGVSGTFGSVTSDSTLAFLNPTLSYTANSVSVALTRNATQLASVAATPMQSNVAGAIASLGPSSPLYNAVITQTAAGAQQAYNATSGLSHSSTERIASTTTRMLNGVVVDRLWDVGGSGLSAQQVVDQFGSSSGVPTLVRCYGPVDPVVPQAPKQSYTTWGEGFGTFGHTDGGANGGTMDRSLGGFILGIDTPLSGIGIDQWRAGVAAGYSDTTYTSHLDGGSGTIQSVFGSVYGGARYGAVDVRVGATVSGQQTDAQRSVAFPGFFETEKSSNGGLTVQGFGEVGYRVAASAFVFEPVAGLAVLHVHQDGFRENGGAAALVSSATDSDVGTTTLGVRSEVAPFKGVPLVAHAFLGWQHLIGNAAPATTLAFEAAGSSPFTVSGTPLDRDALAAEAALDYRLSAALDIGLTYAGTVGATAVDHSVKGRMEYRF